MTSTSIKNRQKSANVVRRRSYDDSKHVTDVTSVDRCYREMKTMGLATPLSGPPSGYNRNYVVFHILLIIRVLCAQSQSKKLRLAQQPTTKNIDAI